MGTDALFFYKRDGVVYSQYISRDAYPSVAGRLLVGQIREAPSELLAIPDDMDTEIEPDGVCAHAFDWTYIVDVDAGTFTVSDGIQTHTTPMSALPAYAEWIETTPWADIK